MATVTFPYLEIVRFYRRYQNDRCSKKLARWFDPMRAEPLTRFRGFDGGPEYRSQSQSEQAEGVIAWCCRGIDKPAATSAVYGEHCLNAIKSTRRACGMVVSFTVGLVRHN